MCAQPCKPYEGEQLEDIPGAVIRIIDKLIIVHPDEDISLEEKRIELFSNRFPVPNQMPFPLYPALNGFSGMNAHLPGFMQPNMTYPAMMNAAIPSPFRLPFMNGVQSYMPLRMPSSIPLSSFGSTFSAGGRSIPSSTQVLSATNTTPFLSNLPAAGNSMSFPVHLSAGAMSLPSSSQIPSARNTTPFRPNLSSAGNSMLSSHVGKS